MTKEQLAAHSEKSKKRYHRKKQDPLWLQARRKKSNAYMRSGIGKLKRINEEAKRRAKKRGVNSDGKACGELIKKWKAATEFECFYCREVFEIKRLHVDHFIPLAKGGPHVPDNLRKSCAGCNLAKGAKLMAV